MSVVISYVIGIEKGVALKDHIFVTNLITSTDFDDEKISFLANVSLEYVQKLRAEANNQTGK